MKIAVCCKFTPDTEDVRLSDDGSVDASKAKWSVSDYDLQAIQAASDIANEAGAEAVALTVGPAKIDQSKLTKDLMSHGNLSALYRVVDDAVAEADTAQVARVLCGLAEKAGADVVVCGEGSSDRYQRVTGSTMAAMLGWPCVTAVDSMRVEGEAIIAERDLEGGIEIVELSAPCVIVTTSTINKPPIPTLKDVLAAGKKPVETFTVADFDMGQRAIDAIGTSAPEQPGRQKTMLSGSPDEIAAQLIEKLTNDGVL